MPGVNRLPPPGSSRHAVCERVGAINSIFIGVLSELGGFESGIMASLLGPVGAVEFGGIGTLVVIRLIARFASNCVNLAL